MPQVRLGSHRGRRRCLQMQRGIGRVRAGQDRFQSDGRAQLEDWDALRSKGRVLHTFTLYAPLFKRSSVDH